MKQLKNSAAFAIPLLLLLISACGIRPKTIDGPPEVQAAPAAKIGAADKYYPRTYPQPGPEDPVYPVPKPK